MRKVAFIIIPVIVVMISLAAAGAHRLSTKEAAVMRSWQTMQKAYGERAELLPRYVRLVATVIGSDHKAVREITAAIDNVRLHGTAPSSAPSPAAAKTLECFVAAQAELTRAVAQLNVIQSRYP